MVEYHHELVDTGLHFTEVIRDWVFLFYALMNNLPINIIAENKLTMCKAGVHQGIR